MMRCFIYLFFFILSMVSYSFAVDSIESMSGNAIGDLFENSEFDEFGEFDEFDEFNDEEQIEVYDPISGYNRFMTQVNDKLYFWFLKPVAQGYSFIVREPVRVSIGNVFDNLGFPIRFVNNLLQLKVKQAGIETARFGVNTTTGLLGLFDPAQSWLELDPCPEDFGQTMGYYGVGSGFHVVLPFLGPSNVRDALGRIPDYFLSPTTYIDDSVVGFAVSVTKVVNTTSLHIGDYESMKTSAIDLYIFFRDAYEMKRENEIEE